MHRVVIDPGVLIAAALSRTGAPAHLLVRWLGGELEIIVSPLLLDELKRVLVRHKFRRHLSEHDALAYVDLIARRATQVADPMKRERIAADPNDDYLLALARAAGARFVVSGDPHLTDLTDSPVPVITPRGLLRLLDLIGL